MRHELVQTRNGRIDAPKYRTIGVRSRKMPHDPHPPVIHPLEIALSTEVCAQCGDPLGAEDHDHALAAWEDDGGAIHFAR